MIAAVREDRTPGGKHRHKRARVDDMPTDGMVNINTILVTGQGDELMTQKLVESRPDLIPNIEGILSDKVIDLCQHYHFRRNTVFSRGFHFFDELS